MVTPFGGIYQGKRVLVTGHTGFKGGWLSLWLHTLGAEVSGYALAPKPGDSLFALIPADTFRHSWIADLRDAESMTKALTEFRPEIIFHLAAQPIVGASYRAPLDTLTTNAVGTAILLEAVRYTDCPAAIVVVTSDKCYRNDNAGRPFKETDPLGGHDIYSMSKAATELVVCAWHASFFANSETLGPLATGRAGNVIGGGDYAEDRLVPDAVRAFASKKPLILRRPHATRPWQHVLDSVSGYLTLGQRLLSAPDRAQLLNVNIGPHAEAERSVRELADRWLATWPGAFQVQSEPQPAYGEATRLRLDHSLAMQELGWRPVWDFQRTVAHTASWYRERHERYADAADMLNFTLEQIHTYTRDATCTGVL